jgi:hypothetical protein
MIDGSIPISPVTSTLSVHTGPLEGGSYIVAGNNLGSGTHTIKLTNPLAAIGAANNMDALHRYTTTAISGTTSISPREVLVPEGWALGCVSSDASPNINGTIRYSKVPN